MKSHLYLLFLLLITFVGKSQVVQKDTIKMGYVLTEKDSILGDTIQLEELLIYKQKLDPEAQKQYNLLRNRVYVTYPYAKLASDRLTTLTKGMSSLTANRDKKKYFKIVEDYVSNEFEAKLKKLSRKQGQILIKLINRQTGITTYDLIKNYKSGWKAFWSNTTARMFDLNLKAPYAPYSSNEDFLIETILVRAFESGRLINKSPATPIDYNHLNNFWVSKAIELNK